MIKNYNKIFELMIFHSLLIINNISKKKYNNLTKLKLNELMINYLNDIAFLRF